MKRILAFLLAFLIVFSMAACGGSSPSASSQPSSPQSVSLPAKPSGAPASSASTEPNPAPQPEPEQEIKEEPVIDEHGYYYSAEDVSLYLYTYGKLPDNFITKSEARELGWEGGSVEKFLDGAAIGGDKFGNREGLLPKAKGRQYYECDIDTDGKNSRGAKRIVFSNDGLIYYTDDHYESFTLLYGEE